LGYQFAGAGKAVVAGDLVELGPVDGQVQPEYQFVRGVVVDVEAGAVPGEGIIYDDGVLGVVEARDKEPGLVVTTAGG